MMTMSCLLVVFSSCLILALLLLEPSFFRGEANLFSTLESGLLCGFQLWKCMEHTQVEVFSKFSDSPNSFSYTARFIASFGKRWKDRVSSLFCAFPQTIQVSPGITLSSLNSFSVLHAGSSLPFFWQASNGKVLFPNHHSFAQLS